MKDFRPQGRSRKRDSEEKITSIPKEHEAAVPDASRRYGIAENTINRRTPKSDRVEVSEAKRLRELEQENARPKRLLADADLDRAVIGSTFGRVINCHLRFGRVYFL